MGLIYKKYYRLLFKKYNYNKKTFDIKTSFRFLLQKQYFKDNIKHYYEQNDVKLSNVKQKREIRTGMLATLAYRQQLSFEVRLQHRTCQTQSEA